MDIHLKPYYDLRTEIYEADGIVLRGDKIIPPISLRKKIINVAHKQGHLRHKQDERNEPKQVHQD